MSFFNSLQQYVTSGVAGLGLSPRRFSLSRQESTEPQQPPPASTQTERRESNNSQHHGEYEIKLLNFDTSRIHISLLFVKIEIEAPNAVRCDAMLCDGRCGGDDNTVTVAAALR